MTRAGTAVRAAAVAVAVAACDQVTKSMARDAVPLGGAQPLLAGIDLVHTRNTGVAFSLLSGGGSLVVVVAVVALVALVAFVLTQGRRRLVWLPTGLLVGGAAGNLVDRLRDGAVTDFLKLPHWPAFNVADVAITVGVVALVVVLERKK